MMKFFGRILVALALALSLAVAPARATVNSAVNKTIVLGDNTTTVFTFNFVGVAAAYISVIYTDASGNETVLTQGAGATQYQISLNAPVTGAIWGVGGTVTYAPSGTPIPAGSTLTIFRTLPLTQAISLQNQNSLARLGNGAETGLDLSVMQSQQIAENIGRAIVAPVVDPTPPAPLPPIAQRANQGAAFDGNGNLVPGAMPASGVISSAMQPVVDAASLAAGRAALGLGTMAQEGIGAGLQDDGAGNARVSSLTVAVAVNQSVDASFAQKTYIATGPITFTLARANTLWNGFSFSLIAFTGPITLSPNAADNFPSLAGGASLVVPQGSTVRITTDGAATGTWYVQLIPQVQGPPQGYLTPCSATVSVTGCTTGNLVPTSDVTAVSALYYQTGPAGSLIPLFNGAQMIMVPFTELPLTLNSNHLANTLYDVCVTYNGGSPTLVTAPAWQTSTAGSGARGASAAITRTSGIWTNNLAITGRNGSLTFSIPANQCTMVGTIAIGSVAGQVNFHRSYGQSRRWDAWNFYNRQMITLLVGDPTATVPWNNTSAAIRASGNNAANNATVLTGLPEETVDTDFFQQLNVQPNPLSALVQTVSIGVGWNATGAFSGTQGTVGANGNTGANAISTTTMGVARYLAPPQLGISTVTALEKGNSAASVVVLFYGTQANMQLTAKWRG